MTDDPRTPNAFVRPLPARSSGAKTVIKVIAGVIAVLVALLLGLIVLFLIGIETGLVALLIGMVSAILPVPIYLVLVLWIDRYEAEPAWMLATAFFWGALVAVFFAFLINTASDVAVQLMTNSARAGHTFGAVVSAPIVEESAKALILLIFFFAKKDEFDGVIDGIVYAAMVGLGFAMTENIQYYGKAVMEGGGGTLTFVFILRGFLAPFSHPMFTSMTGIGLGLARQSRNTLLKWVAPPFRLLAAMAMHSIWNGSGVLFGGGAFILTYILIMIPAFFIMLVVIALALRREGQIVREHLVSEFQGGLFTPEEYRRLCSIFGRMGMSFDAQTRGGVGQSESARHVDPTARDPGIHRHRVARGIKTADAVQREAAYRMALECLLKKS